MKIAWLYIRRFVSLFEFYKYDLIWIEKEIFPYFPAFAERVLFLCGKRYVVDYDDAIFHNYDLSDNLLVRKFLGRKIDSVMRDSSCVIAGNSYLASRAREAGASCVELIPTVVDHDRYIPRQYCNVSEDLVVGWIGSPSTQKYVVGIREALIQVVIKHKNARLILVGATKEIVSEFSGINVEAVPWSEETEAELISKMDVGIMPLPDGPWEKGKCGYKLIQYMACAVPVVASPVGVNTEIINSSNSGFLASSVHDWEAAIVHLLESPELRNLMGSAGRKAVEENYSLQVQSPVLSGIFKEIIQQKNA